MGGSTTSKPVEQFPDINKLSKVASCWTYILELTSESYFSKFAFCKKQKLLSDISKEEISFSVLNVEYNS